MGALSRCFAIALVAATAAAQVIENVTVELIEVPVYVIGPDGRPIRGLTRDSFELRVNRRSQPIEYFDAIDFSSPASAEHHDQRERRLYLLLFDLTFARPARVALAQSAAQKAIDASNPATDLFSVATFSATRGVLFVTPFLRDRVALKRALYTLRSSTARDALGLTITRDEREAWSDVKDPLALETITGGVANQELVRDASRRLVENQFDGVAEAAKRLSGLPGQKHVLLFTEGFESALLHGFSKDEGPPKIDARLVAKLEEMSSRFRDAGVILDSVDIAGLRHSFAVDDEALWILARGTGGQVVHNKNDLAGAITDLTKTQQVVYVLAFNRRGERGGTIDVRVRGVPRGTRLSYRQGFGAAERSNDVDPLQLADILTNDIAQNGLTLLLHASPSELTVELPRAESVEKTPNVDTLIYVFDQNGLAIVAAQKRIVLDGPVLIRQPLALSPGHYVAKAIARVAGTTSLGFARTEFTVP